MIKGKLDFRGILNFDTQTGSESDHIMKPGSGLERNNRIHILGYRVFQFQDGPNGKLKKMFIEYGKLNKFRFFNYTIMFNQKDSRQNEFGLQNICISS